MDADGPDRDSARQPRKRRSAQQKERLRALITRSPMEDRLEQLGEPIAGDRRQQLQAAMDVVGLYPRVFDGPSTEYLGLKDIEVKVLLALEFTDQRSGADIAEILAVDASNVSKALSWLRDHNLIAEGAGVLTDNEGDREDDRRARTHHITDAGREALGEIADDFLDAQLDYFDALDKERPHPSRRRKP